MGEVQCIGVSRNLETGWGGGGGVIAHRTKPFWLTLKRDSVGPMSINLYTFSFQNVALFDA